MRKFLAVLFSTWLAVPAFGIMKKQDPDDQYLKKKKRAFISTSNVGWTFYQNFVDFSSVNCGAGQTTCTFTISSTHAGAVQIVGITTGNNVTISSCSIGTGNCTLCASSACHVFNATDAINQDAAYIIGGQGGQTTVSVTLSGASASAFIPLYIEIVPPPGSTASIDAVNALVSNSCNTCALPSISPTATDAVVYIGTVNNSGAQWNNCNNNMYSLSGAGCVALNATTMTSPTVKQNGSASFTAFSGLAFKSSLGTFTATTPNFLVVNETSSDTSCSPTCTITIPATTIGNLLFIQNGAGSSGGGAISSVSGGGGTWTNCAGADISGTPGHLSCAYNLSPSSSITSVSVTMASNGSNGFAVWEVKRNSGSWALDTQGSTSNAATLRPTGQALTLSGSNDLIFQSIQDPGGANPGPTFADIAPPAYLQLNQASGAGLINTTNGNAPLWLDPQNVATLVNGIAFQ
jgi:predicted outer membrane repeat protein